MVSNRKATSNGKSNCSEVSIRRCPDCNSTINIRKGNRYISGLKVQRFLCKTCGYRFTDPEFSGKNQINNLKQTGSRQICVLDEKAKNLVRAKTETEALRENDIKGEIVSFAFHLMKLGRSEATIATYTKYVENINRYGDINDPESIKLAIATHFKDNNTKRLACCAYDAYTKSAGLSWNKPNYKIEHKRVFIPNPEELQLAINCGHKESVVYSKFLYETGARTNEAQKLEWTELDNKRKKATIKSSKNGNARILPISETLMSLLSSLPKNNKNVFRKCPKYSRSSSFHNRMVRLAKIHNNPRMVKIHLHTFRHCKALREYHKIQRLTHVQRVLGHKSILTTYRYIALYEELYADMQPKDYVCETVSTSKEASKLIQKGFEYVCDIDGEKLFKRLKT